MTNLKFQEKNDSANSVLKYWSTDVHRRIYNYENKIYVCLKYRPILFVIERNLKELLWITLH